MGFDNEYPNRKDWRQPYRRAARVYASCRPNGGCPWCERSRQHNWRKKLLRAADELKAYRREDSRLLEEQWKT